MLNNSILIAAHPDDDILWFSSILNDVGSILFCFSDYPAAPQLGTNRKKVLTEYPLENVSSLELTEPQSFGMANWDKPTLSRFGIQLEYSREGEARYQHAYHLLKEKLSEKLCGVENVFTHNPWGEYGHEDHILVYRVIKDLQRSLNFNIWYSNYCSNRSFTLLTKHISGFHSDYKTLPTNHSLAKEISNIYVNHNCWTWYDDYCWFNEECMIEDVDRPQLLDYGHIFPLNFIKVDFLSASNASPLRRFVEKHFKKTKSN